MQGSNHTKSVGPICGGPGAVLTFAYCQAAFGLVCTSGIPPILYEMKNDEELSRIAAQYVVQTGSVQDPFDVPAPLLEAFTNMTDLWTPEPEVAFPPGSADEFSHKMATETMNKLKALLRKQLNDQILQAMIMVSS